MSFESPSYLIYSFTSSDSGFDGSVLFVFVTREDSGLTNTVECVIGGDLFVHKLVRPYHMPVFIQLLYVYKKQVLKPKLMYAGSFFLQ